MSQTSQQARMESQQAAFEAQGQGQPLSACQTCTWRAANSPIANMTIAGRCYRLPCGHTQCSACLTLHQHVQGSQTLPILCSVCAQDGGFSFPSQDPLTQVDALVSSPVNLKNIRELHWLDPASPNFAARNTCIVDGEDFRAIFDAVYRLTMPLHQDIVAAAPFPQHVFNALASSLAPGLRYTTPELLEAELKIILDDALYDTWCRHEGARYHLAWTTAVKGDPAMDLRIQTAFLGGLKKLHTEVGRAAVMWEGVISWAVAVLAAKWWARFG
ncbi:hypothetical protein HBH53_076210 [Parastagonospora nodorum]|nr:hypothetical protein HBH53_076210 [Parastagonospora nodorum]